MGGLEPFLNHIDKFSALFFKTCAKLDDEKRSLFAIVLWSLLKKMNDKLWEGSEAGVN